MQDMYAHYLNQYMQYVNMAQMTSQFPTNIVNQQPETPETNQPAPDPAQREQPEAGQVLAAGGGGLVQEEVAGGERDILDWMYLSSRLVLLLSIVYFYSSIGRFVIVLCIGGLFYFYQVLWYNFEDEFTIFSPNSICLLEQVFIQTFINNPKPILNLDLNTHFI